MNVVLNIYLHYHNAQDLQFQPKMPLSYLSYKCKNHSGPWSLVTNILKQKPKDLKTRGKKQTISNNGICSFSIVNISFSEQSRWILKNNQMALQARTVRILVLPHGLRDDRQARARPAYQPWKWRYAEHLLTGQESAAEQCRTGQMRRSRRRVTYLFGFFLPFFSFTSSLPLSLSSVRGWEVKDRGRALRKRVS